MTSSFNPQSELRKSQMFSLGQNTLALIEINSEPFLPFAVGTIIDQKYQVVSLLGEGGMGAVYRVRHLHLDKIMALKTFRTREITGKGWQRFQQEAKIIARLNHPHVVQIFDFGVAEGSIPYFTMELLHGNSLAIKLSKTGRLPLEETISIFLKVAAGLLAIHNKGIVHGDIKPANIVLEEAGHNDSESTVKLVDFGISRLTTETSDDQFATGEIYGSPLYMSPEQFQGRKLSIASDIYSFACTLYETISGRVPFLGANALATMNLHLTVQAPTLASCHLDEQLPQRLEGLLARMLAKSAEDRPASFAQVIDELASVRLSLTNRDTLRGNTNRTKKPDSVTLDSNVISQSPKKLQRYLWQGIAWFAITVCAAGALLFTYTKKAEVLTSEKHSHFLRVETGQFDKTGKVKSATRKLEFPPGLCLGELSSVPTYQNRRPASDSLEVQTDVCYYPNKLVSTHPDLLNGFGPYSLAQVETHTGKGFDERHLRILSTWRSLKRLSLKGSTLTAASIPFIDAMPTLKILSVAKAEVTAQDLNTLKKLQNIQSLDLSGVKGAGLIFRSHEGFPQLIFLHANYCGLTDADLTAIAKSRNLHELRIARNLDITDDGVRALTSLQQLEWLDLNGTSIGPSSISTLAGLKSLRRLSVPKSNFKELDLLRLRKALPTCTVN